MTTNSYNILDNSDHENNYAKYHDLRYSLMEKVRNKLPKKHNSTRNYSSMESYSMFNKFKKSQLVEKKLDISKINKSNIGNYINHSLLKSFNTISISGPKQLVDSFLNQDPNKHNINIFINSVRYIPGGDQLWDLDFVISNKIDQYQSSQYISQEQPFTQQYCNWYNYFESDKNFNYDNVFVVIVTTELLYNAYRDIYPHFIICTQMPCNISGVGLTKYCSLSLAYYIGLKKILFIDDNVVDLAKYKSTMSSYSESSRDDNSESSHDKMSSIFDIAKFISELFVINEIAGIPIKNFGILGFGTGHIGNDIYEQYLSKNNFISDQTIFLKSTDDIPIRIYTPNKLSNTNHSWCIGGDRPVPNPHRPKIIFLNTGELIKKNINFNLSHIIGEDIHLTKSIYLNKLLIGQFGLIYIAPFDDRRPKLSIHENVTLDNKRISSDYNYRFMNQNIIDRLNQHFFIETMADFIMLNGKIMYINSDGVYGGSGAYGPIRIVTKKDVFEIKNKIGSHHDSNRIIQKGFLGSNNLLSVYYIRPNRFKLDLTNTDYYTRSHHINDYFIFDKSEYIDYKSKKYTDSRDFLLKILQMHDLACSDKVNNDNILYLSSGMPKYILQYEFINNELIRRFSLFCQKKIFSDLISSTLKKISNKIKFDKNDMIINDFTFYLEQYIFFPKDIHKLCVLLSLFIRFNAFQNIINNNILLTDSQYEYLIMSFGSLYNIYYQPYDLSTDVDDFLTMVLDSTIQDNKQYRIIIKPSYLTDVSYHIYNKIINTY